MRRRFLALSVAALACPAEAAPQTWRGRALGAEVSLTVQGLDAGQGARLWRRVARDLKQVEQAVSLFRASELVRLNKSGVLVNPGTVLRALVDLSDRVHHATDGAFDPTVQALWEGRSETGWHRIDRTGIRLPPGMALTFNGVAQGFAADRLAALMRAEGLTDVLIDAGEVVALGPHPVTVAAPNGLPLKRLTLHDRALATSSPMATRLTDGRPHILHPTRPARHGTVSVSAQSAALADALSTAFCLMTEGEIARALQEFPGARVETLA